MWMPGTICLSGTFETLVLPYAGPVRPTVAVLHHLESPFLGHAGPVLQAAGVRLDQRDLRRGASLPALDEVDGIVSLGGEQSVIELDRHLYLAGEVELLGAAARAGVPVLGVCLGGQLLAHALGAAVQRMPRRMVCWAEVEALPEASGDPLVRALGGQAVALHWNEDFFELPRGAIELLSPAGPGCEAFRHGAAWGVQFHPEVDAQVLDGWYREASDWLREAGVEEARARAEDARHLPGQRATAEAVFGAFAAEVQARAGRSAQLPH